MVGYARLKLREPMVTHGNLWQPTINEQAPHRSEQRYLSLQGIHFTLSTFPSVVTSYTKTFAKGHLRNVSVRTVSPFLGLGPSSEIFGIWSN